MELEPLSLLRAELDDHRREVLAEVRAELRDIFSQQQLALDASLRYLFVEFRGPAATELPQGKPLTLAPRYPMPVDDDSPWVASSAKKKIPDPKEKTAATTVIKAEEDEDATAQADALREDDEDEYNVENFYHETGVFQALARSEVFQNITLAVISANAVYLGVDADTNTAKKFNDSDIGYRVTEHIFCTFFVFELLVRFGAFKFKTDCLRDHWFRFDALLVPLMVAETWVMPRFDIDLPLAPLRLVRLLRLSRLVRLMRSIPELVMMVKGVRGACRGVLSSLLMITLLIYTFAIVIYMLLGDAVEETVLEARFKRLPWTMWCLLMDGTFMDSTSFVLTELINMWTVSTISAVVVFMIFILLSAMTVMNMLIGVLCEVVSAVAQDEKEDAAIRLVKQTILVELKKYDADGSGAISRDELEGVLMSKHALQVLKTLDIDAGCLHELSEMLFAHHAKEIPIKTVMDLLVLWRGNIGCTVKHMVDMLSFARFSLSEGIKVQIQQTDAHMQSLQDELTRLAAWMASPQTTLYERVALPQDTFCEI